VEKECFPSGDFAIRSHGQWGGIQAQRIGNVSCTSKTSIIHETLVQVLPYGVLNLPLSIDSKGPTRIGPSFPILTGVFSFFVGRCLQFSASKRGPICFLPYTVIQSSWPSCPHGFWPGPPLICPGSSCAPSAFSLSNVWFRWCSMTLRFLKYVTCSIPLSAPVPKIYLLPKQLPPSQPREL